MSPPTRREPPTPDDVTALIRRWRSGEEAAGDDLWRLVYDDLRGLARGVRRRQAAPAGQHTTTLVHEAFLRLLGPGADIDYADRGHFFAVAVRAMRFVLVDEARKVLADKRRGDLHAAELPEEPPSPERHAPEDVLAIHRAVVRLGRVNPRYEKMVEARYFAGFSVDETAEMLGVSRPTVVRDWRAVRTWLWSELGGSRSGAPA